jgi:cytochrome oxidase Cu insertion factor (SCO1/SenC/PrrC family)
MDALTFRSLVVLATVTLGVHTLPGADQERRLHPLPELDQNVKTGPAIGSKIPLFEAVDQNGRRQTFETLRGPKGLVLLFFRSADW